MQRCRKQSGLTQTQLAKKLRHGNPQFVSNVERGLADPPLKTIHLWCRFIGADKYRVKEILLDEYNRDVILALKL